MTPELIDRLTAELTPTPRGAVAGRLALGLSVGAAVSTALVLVALGPRPDMMRAMGGPMFWIKLAYTLALAAAAFFACERLARPAGGAKRGGWLLLPLALLAAAAAWRLMQAPPGAREAMMLGSSWTLCPWYILASSAPPFAGAVWAMRSLAPTRLRLAGAMAGVMAGGAGAAAYALHCTESAFPFLAVWYTAGVAGAGLMGAALGPRVLRW